MGVTARFLNTCQNTMEKLTSDMQEERIIRSNTQKQILEEYKKIRLTYEECVKQMTIANQLREEKNQLLKEFIKDIKK